MVVEISVSTFYIRNAHRAHRMTVAGVTVGLGDAVTERQGSPSFSPTVRRSVGGEWRLMNS